MLRQKLVLSAITMAYLSFTLGCQPKEETLSPAAKAMAEHADHDHDEHGHDHDGHDHDEDHDHEGHSHEGHEHDDGGIDIGALMPIEVVPAPESFAAGVEQLTALRDTVGKGFADDDVDSIHDQLHSVGNLLENVEILVNSSDLSDEAKTKAKQAIEELFDAYGDVDLKLHGQKGKDYSDVSDDIDTAIKTLQALTAAEKE